MRTSRILPACIIVVTAVTGLAAQQTSTTTKHTEIDGAKTPELVPEWLRWEMFLVRTSQLVISPVDRAPEVLNNRLFLPSVEVAALQTEGKLQNARRKQLEDATRVVFDTFDRNGKPPDQVLKGLHQASFELQLRYRGEVLAARDRVLATVLPESALAIDRWIREVLVPNVRLLLHPLDVSNFSLPR